MAPGKEKHYQNIKFFSFAFRSKQDGSQRSKHMSIY